MPPAPHARLAPLATFAFTLLLPLAATPRPAGAGGLVNPFQPFGWSPYSLQFNGQFGFSVAPAGDFNGDGFGDVIVGAFGEDNQFMDEGRVHLFLGSPTGPAATSNRYVYPNQVGAAAGLMVSSAGDVNGDGYSDFLVGVPLWNSVTHDDVGKVMVYHGGTNLPFNPTYELLSPAPAAMQNFGRTVAPAGDVNGDGYDDVVVGAPFFVDGLVSRGRVWVFHGGPSGLSATPARTWTGTDNSQFGGSLSPAGDVNGDGYADVIVGAPLASVGLASNGAAYVFLGSAAGAAAAPDTTVAGTEANENCGLGVGNAGDVNGDGYADVLVGSPYFGANNEGRCRLLRGGPGGIASGVFLANSEVAANEAFGARCVTVGDIDADGFADIAVTSRYVSGGSRGRVVVYRGGPNGVTHVGDILTPGGSTGYFGNAIAGSGDTDGDGFSEILVGTEDWSIAPNFFEGRVFSYVPPRSALRLSPNWPLTGPQPGTGYGSALAFLPKASGSVFPVLALGDPGHNGTGKVSLFSSGVFSGISDTELGLGMPAAGAFQGFGRRLADVGDVDRNAYTDFLVASTTADSVPFFQAGRVDLHPGTIAGLGSPATVLAGSHDFDRVGSALAGRGDVNGDGYHDFVVGAWEWDAPGAEDGGRAWLFLGSPGGPLASSWTRQGTSAGEGVGASVALADLDGDGYSDVVIGSSAPESVIEPTGSGRVEVFYGGPAGPPLQPGLELTPRAPDPSYGRAVASLGDVNGDGVCDLGVGAPNHRGVGGVFVYEGTLGRSQTNTPIRVYEGAEAGARLGAALAGGGDIDGDGFGDLAIGSPGYDGGFADQGRVDVHLGAPEVPAAAPHFTYTPGFVGARLGETIAPIADGNLDGFADVAVGAPGAAGRAYAFLGGLGPGHVATLALSEQNLSNVRRVHPARIDDPDAVRSELIYASPAGRARIGVEFEVATHNEAFTGVPTQETGLVHDSGAPDNGVGPLSSAIQVTQDVGLPWPGRGYRVRARFVTGSPFFPRSRWLTPEAHVSGDHDVWTSGEVVAVPSPGTRAPGVSRVAPNPARRGTGSHIDFVLERQARVRVDIYDVRGARVARLLDAERPGGVSTQAWDGRNDDGHEVPAGLYFAAVTIEGRTSRARLVRMP